VKILLVRFSSIGDIVLTSPVIRCLKKQIPNVTLHFLTKKKFESIVNANPNIDRVITIEKNINEVTQSLKKEKYDYVIDLHHNIRTLRLKWKLGVKNFSFPKLNIQKWLLVQFKINQLPKKHIVERYFEAVKSLNVVNDQLPCDYFIPSEDEIKVAEKYQITQFVAIAIGAQFATKRLPVSKMSEIIEKIDVPIILLGDQFDTITAQELINKFPDKQMFNACGTLNLNQSASVVKQAAVLLTHDTGLMHIASAFQIKIVSVWGNTVPDFGMYPYYPQKKEAFSIHEVKGLACRPCSKIGFQSCPKKHFKCMNLQDSNAISDQILKAYKA
jgi:ADP-heptose:LPS heptosyltransferase